ncbi:MAG: mismatch-specific DNA-glycosylase, partial [Actinomycetia bacterium]|nr:mismatch-specific DNA-glycosylase [Actinomycetes bacterium]
MRTFDLPATRLPLALADAHRSLAVGEHVEFRVPPRVGADRFRDVVDGAGFTVERVAADGRYLRAGAIRARTLPDYVAPGMRVLFVGLNPSEYAADAGVGFARPGNRFWPALLEAAIVTRDRDPRHALVHHRVGMTDLVKRATPRADALSRDEYREGAERVRRLVSWLAPGAVGIVGLTGWRHAIDRRATVGWQEEPFGGRPVYVMPNTSGLNARVPLAAFARHVASASAPR